jgi:hypothetical protein
MNRELCLADIREAHEWATQALRAAETIPGYSVKGLWELQQERIRLAHRLSAVKKGANPDGSFPSWKFR